MRSIVKIVLFLLVFLSGLLLLTFYLTVLKPLPDYSAEVRLEGLAQPVDIHWGPYGVPQLYARSQPDLFHAVGYVHAQDRIWQMTVSQMAAEGRFAEFLGPDLVPFDRYQRTLGFWRTAGEIEQAMPDSIHALLQAYADGVNAWTRENRRNLPLEFSLVKMKPIEWTPRHTIAISRLMAWDQNINWWSELTLAWLQTQLPAARMRELIPDYPDTKPVTGRQASAAMPLLETELAMRSWMGKPGTSVGSNAWVADAERTKTGYPLLAGDPHMGLSMPGNWYEISAHAPGFDVSGATIPGAPFVVVGQNAHLAWTLTNIMADDTDFFLERLDPADSTRVVVEQGGRSVRSVPLRIIREVIKVKDAGDVVHTTRLTPNGPLIDGIYPERELVQGERISVRWTGHAVSQELQALYQMNTARDLASFRAAASGFKAPGMNATYADREGNIAMFAMAGLPKRTRSSLSFRRGWVPGDAWDEPIPFDELPSVVNPAKGWIANANNKIHSDRYPYYLATFWEPPSRIERLVELFATSDTLTPAVFAAWQSDAVSVHARELLEQILPILIEADASAEWDFSTALDYLLNWDFAYTETSTAASLLDVFYTTLTRNTLLDEFGETAYRNFVRLENLPVRSMKRLLRLNSPLFDDVNTPERETREQMVARSLQQAIDWLTEHHGPEPHQWRWGNLHTLSLRPPIFAQAADDSASPAALRLIVDNVLSKGPFPVPGHGMSLNNGQYDWNDSYRQVLGASIRRIVDLSDLSSVLSVIPTGQSGNAMSEHFGDQTPLWLEGRHKRMYQDSLFFRESSYTSMRLTPQ